MLLIYLALQAWKLEHGEYPDSLDQLVGTYLKEIPKMPYFNIPYVYRPKPKGFEQELAGRTHDVGNWPLVGQPYLFAPKPNDPQIDQVRAFNGVFPRFQAIEKSL